MANISLNVGATSVNASLMTPTNIKDGSVTTSKLADGAVTTEKLSDAVRGQISDLKSAVEHLTDNLINVTTEASNPLVITDGGDGLPVKDCVVNIQPSQPNAYGSVWVGGAGKNLVDIAGRSISEYTGTARIRTESCTATKSGDVLTVVNSGAWSKLWVQIDPSILTNGETYTLSAKFTNASGGMVGLNARVDGNWQTGGTFSSATNATLSYSFTFDSSIQTLVLGLVTNNSSTANTNTVVIEKIMLEKGSTATSYEPYSNICPISGWTEAEITRCGKNLYNPAEAVDHYWLNTSNGTLEQASSYWTSGYIPIVKGVSYIFRAKGSTRNCYYDKDKTFIESFAMTGGGEFVAKYDGYIRVTGATSVFPYDGKFQLELGATATAVEPYTGTTYSVDLSSAGTVYGGTLDVTTGVLTVTKARIDLNGSSSENWQEYSVAQGELHRIINVPRKDGTIPQVSVISDCYRTVSTYESRSENTISGTGTFVDIIDSDYATLTEWKAHIAESPIELVYELATPQTYQLTPTEVTTLLKNNTLTANCGTVSLSYYADTKTYIDNAIATAVASL